MYLDRQRYTVFWLYTICRPNNKTKINRTYRHPHRRSVFYFLHVAIRNSLRSYNIREKSKQASCAQMVLGLFFSFARVIQQLRFGTNVDYCSVRRRECTSLGPGLTSIQAYAQTLVWQRRDVPSRFTWYFSKTKHPSPARELLLCEYTP